MIQFLLAAPNSGSGKTTLACALLAALKNRGYAPCAFKAASRAQARVVLPLPEFGAASRNWIIRFSPLRRPW